MNRTILHIISILLIASLVVDPALAATHQALVALRSRFEKLRIPPTEPLDRNADA